MLAIVSKDYVEKFDSRAKSVCFQYYQTYGML